jgi:hypothetical protein
MAAPMNRLLDSGLTSIQPGGTRPRRHQLQDSRGQCTTGLDQIYSQKQPGTVPDRVDVSWNNGNGTYLASSDFSQDRVIILSTTGVTQSIGHPAEATCQLGTSV